MYLQFGVRFTCDPDPSMNEYHYKWYHVSSGNSDSGVVYCESAEEFLKLLIGWNRSKNFIYYPVEQ